MTNFVINEYELDDEIVALLENEGFSTGNIGTFCYKEVIKNAVYKLIEYSNSKDGEMLHGSLLSSMCLLDSEFYKEVYDKMITKKIFNISNIEEVHSLIKSALPENNQGFTSITYMMKANALAYSIMGKIKKQNGFVKIKENYNKDNDIVDNKIMCILETYGFNKDSLGTFCYKEVIKEVIVCMNSNIDNYIALGEKLKEDTSRSYSYFYINVWGIIASTKRIKSLELDQGNNGFEFNFAYMQMIIKEALCNSDLALKLNDSNYSEVLSTNINEIATMVIKELQSGKISGFGKVKQIDRGN